MARTGDGQRLRSTSKDEFALALPPFKVDPLNSFEELEAFSLDSGNTAWHQLRRCCTFRRFCVADFMHAI
jgi:hypothetical protein